MKKRYRIKAIVPMWRTAILLIVIWMVVFFLLFRMEEKVLLSQTQDEIQQLMDGVGTTAMSEWYGDEEMTLEDVKAFMTDVMPFVSSNPASFAAEFYDREGDLLYQSADINAYMHCFGNEDNSTGTSDEVRDRVGAGISVGDIHFCLEEFLPKEALDDLIQIYEAGTLGEVSYVAGYLEETGAFIPVRIVFQSLHDEHEVTYEWLDQQTWNLLEETYKGCHIESDGCGEVFLIAYGSFLDPLASELYKNADYARVGVQFQVLNTQKDQNAKARECIKELHDQQSVEIYKSWASESYFSGGLREADLAQVSFWVKGGGVCGIMVMAYPIHRMAWMSWSLWGQMLVLSLIMVWIFVIINKGRKQQDGLHWMRNTFLNAMAHEMKTPAAVIKNSAECVLEGICVEKNEHYLKLICKETDRMNELLTKMLTYSRTMDGGQRLQKVTVDLPQIARNICESYQELMERRGLTVAILTETMDQTMADPNLIEMVVDNFVSNAVRYAKQGSQIQIVLSKNRFQIENACEELSKEMLEQVWDPMYVVEKSRAKTDGSAGMGLAICKNILDLHKAKYGAERTENGVRFFFSL